MNYKICELLHDDSNLIEPECTEPREQPQNLSHFSDPAPESLPIAAVTSEIFHVIGFYDSNPL